MVSNMDKANLSVSLYRQKKEAELKLKELADFWIRENEREEQDFFKESGRILAPYIRIVAGLRDTFAEPTKSKYEDFGKPDSPESGE